MADQKSRREGMIVQYYGIPGMKKPGEGFLLLALIRTIDESKMTIRAKKLNTHREDYCSVSWRTNFI